jgi:hypothetical protein
VDGAVEGTVAAAVEPVPDGLATAGWEWAGAAEGGEGSSLRQRPGWEKLTMAWAALTGPTP